MLWDQNNSLEFWVFFLFGVFFVVYLFSYKAEDRLSVRKCVGYRLFCSWFSLRGSRLRTDPWADPGASVPVPPSSPGEQGKCRELFMLKITLLAFKS